PPLALFFFFTVPATTVIYTLSLHDALPIFIPEITLPLGIVKLTIDLDVEFWTGVKGDGGTAYIARSALESDADIGKLGWSSIDIDRKSTRLNSSHVKISYAVFCLKKKKKHE